MALLPVMLMIVPDSHKGPCENWGLSLGVLINTDYDTLGSILGYPGFGDSHNSPRCIQCIKREPRAGTGAACEEQRELREAPARLEASQAAAAEEP